MSSHHMTLHYMTNPFIISKHKSQFLSQLQIEGTATKAFSSTVGDAKSHDMECGLIM